ncbi:MAG TPA: hypothetical protein VLJ61_17300 [Pyrinomonadaceae bacterium]|nr:hypothetical protein [Pyrinomonadaceae bacterium]
MNDATKKRSALVIASLAIASLAGFGLVIFEGIGVLDHEGDEVLIGALLSLLITPFGIIVGLIALFKRRTRFGLEGLAGLILNTLFLALSLFMILKAFVEEVLKGMAAVH